MVEQIKKLAHVSDLYGGVIGIPDWNPTPAEESDTNGVPPPIPTSIDIEEGGEDSGSDEELAHVNNVQKLRRYESLEDPLVTKVLEAIRERGERSVSRTIVGRTLQYAHMQVARDKAMQLSHQALDTAKDCAEAARQLSSLVRHELAESV